MEIDLPLYSPSLTVCIPSTDYSAFRLQPGSAAAAAAASAAAAAAATAAAAQHCGSPTAACVVKHEGQDDEDDFLKDILDLPDTLSPPDSGCHTGQSTPAYRCDFPILAFSPPSFLLDEEEDDEEEKAAAAAAAADADADLDVDADAIETDSSLGCSDPADGVSDYELVTLSIKDLNVRLRNLPKSRVLQLKHRRRTLKNRQYAHVCRLRRQKSQAELATESVGMARQITLLRQQLDRVTRERDHYRDELRRAHLRQRDDTFNPDLQL